MSVLKSHMATAKHKRAAIPYKFTPIQTTSQNRDIHVNEARIALYIAKHSTIRAVDHLVKVNKCYGTLHVNHNNVKNII